MKFWFGYLAMVLSPSFIVHYSDYSRSLCSLCCFTLIFVKGEICLILPFDPRLVLNKLLELHYFELFEESKNSSK